MLEGGLQNMKLSEPAEAEIRQNTWQKAKHANTKLDEPAQTEIRREFLAGDQTCKAIF